MWSFDIPSLAPKPGTLHWAAMNKQKKSWAQHCYLKAMTEGCPTIKERERRSVRIERWHAGPAMDVDNLHACLKVPLDALQRANLIWTDSPKYLDLEVVDVPGQSGKGFTRIVLGEPESVVGAG